MAVRLTILGSGSSGNCAYLESDDTRILIDAGFSLRQLRQRLAAIGRAPEGLTGVLVTHEHSDHINGLATLCSKLQIPIYCNRLTRDAAQFALDVKLEHCRIFETRQSFEVGNVVVESFDLPHDAADPVGFLLRTHAGNIGFMTDLGHATKSVLQRVRAANVLVLETNHDLKLLQESSRPWSLKQRIAGRHGHLSNTDAADAAQSIMSADLHHLYLGHLSRECNLPDLAQRVMDERLQKIGATHVRTELTWQHKPCETYELGFLARAKSPAKSDTLSLAETHLRIQPTLNLGL